MRAKELQTSTLEKQDILQFEIHLAAATNKATITGKSLSEALLFAEHGENINCSECQKQFLYTTCFPHVLSFEFSCIELL